VKEKYCAQKGYSREMVEYLLSNQIHSSQQHICMCLSLHMFLHFGTVVNKLLYSIMRKGVCRGMVQGRERVAYVLSNQIHSSHQCKCMCLFACMHLHFCMFDCKLLFSIVVLIEEVKELSQKEYRGMVQREGEDDIRVEQSDPLQSPAHVHVFIPAHVPPFLHVCEQVAV
jgi:hypothetical protein